MCIEHGNVPNLGALYMLCAAHLYLFHFYIKKIMLSAEPLGNQIFKKSFQMYCSMWQGAFFL